jgi:phosphorylcholine metabolism protein LicD
MEWNNYKKTDAGNDKYSEERMKLAVFLRDSVFVHLPNTIFIENGTLLGAWRNSKFIDLDDDFDFGILIDSKSEISHILESIRDRLPENYKCRRVDSYADKIEIYEPIFGDYTLTGPDYNNKNYHYVTVDLQFYLKQDSGQYRWMYYISNPISIDISLLEPCGEILLEGETFKCPNKIEEFLTLHYGYLGEDAVYSEETKLYKKK